MDLYIIRHGQSVGNVSRMVQGSMDLGLTEEGLRQADLLAARLKDVHFDAIYTSPMKRARGTAEAIVRGRDIDLIDAPWLAEINTGYLSGMPHDEIAQKYPGFFTKPLRERDGFPGGESNIQFYGRVAAGFDVVHKRYSGTNSAIAVVTHIATINAIFACILGIEYVPYLRFMVSSTSVSKIVINPLGGEDVPYVHSINDTSHLNG